MTGVPQMTTTLTEQSGLNWLSRFTTFSDVLDFVRPVLSARLIDSANWTRMTQTLAVLPAAAAEVKFGFEFPLAQQDAGCDVSFAVPLRTAIADRYTSYHTGSQTPSSSPAGLSRFLEELQQPGSFLSGFFAHAVLEYDILSMPDMETGIKAPGLYLCTRQELDKDHINPGVICATLAFVAARPQDAGQLRAMERIWGLLPESSKIWWCGAMLGRTSAATRLVVFSPWEEIRALLTRIGYPGPMTLVDDILEVDDFNELAVEPALSLDVTSQGVHGRLGIELFRNAATSRATWSQLGEILADRGWCLPEKAAEYARCTGSENFLSRDGTQFVLHYGANHIKLVIEEWSVAAKGYTACVLDAPGFSDNTIRP